MCALDEDPSEYVAAYSFGIAGRDGWGEEVSRTIGVVVHQYDCTGYEARPSCESPCRSVFHWECLTGLGLIQKYFPSNNLAGHLERNGHEHAKEGQLLLKVDVEGAEWDVFRWASVTDLQKFRQIVVEFHHTYVNVLMDRKHLEARVAAMRNILQVFVVVHVHANNNVQSRGSLLTVSFCHRNFVELYKTCRKPERHELDEPDDSNHDEIDVGELFDPLMD
eukprot:gnl/MRDRNA2_/MRDRNA2_80426_c0_seq1.p1 gnl/MRDRNA2_/MRDRNA2_80426_c0~~gnl/MRDRNA2_/MRDRNA2_80426_c0_seq1.p1  ORF type:complete len:253 (+),score=36.92 gnl/MRDRNA2_/MRDRNA2_80426_c0_seq1:97-759(+)